jgi:hypothetical protein
MYLPKALPSDRETEFLGLIAMIIALCEKNGVTIDITERIVTESFWNVLSALGDAIKGAFFCLDRDNIVPSDSIPSEYKQGWNMALWYAYASAAKDTTDGKASYLTISRTTTLATGTSQAWSGKETLADKIRLESTIRTLAQMSAKRVGAIKSFLKKKGYFIETYGGKKPVGGIYTEDELPLLVREWEDRIARIGAIYDRVPDAGVYDTYHSTMEGISVLVASFQVRKSDTVKNIEECANKRIPDLLILSGKGKDRKKTIAKGGSLGEKLIAIGGGENVRTIGKVMWTPSSGYSKTNFVEACIAQARSIYTRSPVGTWVEQEKRRLDGAVGIDQTVRRLMADTHPLINAAALVYLECLEERRGEPSWDAVFPHL